MVYCVHQHLQFLDSPSPAKPCSSVQFSRLVVSDSATPWIAARQASLSITNSRSPLKLISIESVMPSSHLILCHPLLLLPPNPPSISVFSNESTLRKTVSLQQFNQACTLLQQCWKKHNPEDSYHCKPRVANFSQDYHVAGQSWWAPNCP